jgi:predicted nucleotidyltransferase
VKVVGIIVEYNPLHNGHQYHFEQAKQITGADTVVAVMSGNFLQRGEPAIVNKWSRTQMALQMGADLVLELPVSYSTQSAELFAHGSVFILDATGVVDGICFGSESGEIGWMNSLSKTLIHEPEDFKRSLRTELDSGLSYPAAYGQAVRQWTARNFTNIPESEEISIHQPNNILGLHYLMAIHRIGSRIRPYTITRQKAGYHQQDITDIQIASATAIRRILFEEKNLDQITPYVPSFTLEQLQNNWQAKKAPISFESFQHPLFHAILTQSVSQLSQIYECAEGMEYRLMKALRQADSVKNLIERIKSKRYTWNRIQRFLLNILLGRTKKDVQSLNLWEGPRYIRVLGFTQTGQRLLHEMRKKAKVPVITKVTREPDSMLLWDIRAAEIYSLAYGLQDSAERTLEYRQPPIKV